MGFDAQAFATAFLTKLGQGIDTRVAEAKEFEKETGNPDALPNRIHPRTARRRRISQRRARRLARRNNKR